MAPAPSLARPLLVVWRPSLSRYPETNLRLRNVLRQERSEDRSRTDSLLPQSLGPRRAVHRLACASSLRCGSPRSPLCRRLGGMEGCGALGAFSALGDRLRRYAAKIL